MNRMEAASSRAALPRSGTPNSSTPTALASATSTRPIPTYGSSLPNTTSNR